MQSFKDDKDRSWTISVDAVSVDIVQANHQVDLLEVEKMPAHDDPRDSVEFQLVGRPLLFCRVMWDLLIERPADVSFEDFARSLTGDTLQAARDALWADIVNFTPDPDVRRVRKAMQEKLKAILRQGMERLQKLLESPDVEKLLGVELDRLDATFMSSLEESALLHGVSLQPLSSA